MAEQLPVQFEFKTHFSFTDFYPGPNQVIVKHLKHCAEGQGELLLFLWGDAGFGKSHLLQATCQWAQNHHRSCLYLDLTQYARQHPEILENLEHYQLVCLDNIQAITGITEWEQAVFHFFNRQRDNGHQLIISANQSANEIAFKLPDLKTRLSWGLNLKIAPLSDDENIEALTLKAKQLGFNLPPQTGRFLLSHYQRNLPALWQLLTQLDRASLAAQRKLTIPFLKQFLKTADE